MKVTQLPLHVALEEIAKAHLTQAALEALHSYRVAVQTTQVGVEVSHGSQVSATVTQLVVEVVRESVTAPLEVRILPVIN